MRFYHIIHHEYRRATRRALAALLAALLGCAGAVAEQTPSAEPTPIIEDEAWMDGDAAALRIAQRKLIELSLLAGSADGVYGPKTEAALRAYQEQNGLEASGHLDAATYEALTHVDPATATDKDVQQRLIDLGYLKGKADGIFGPRSQEALRLFQRLSGLSVNGKPSEAAKEALFAADALALPPSLTGGDKGDEVEKLQRQLIQFGFMDGEPDASYGQSTLNAVRSFQRHLIDQGYTEGITADGAASPLTLYCLYNEAYSCYLKDVASGDKDGEALRIERRLYQLGYMDQDADDTLDDYAVEALKLFQDQMYMEPDGVADRATQDALFSPEAPPAEHCALHDIAFGDSGIAVRDAQEALICGGMTASLPDGKYGSATETAVTKLHDYLVKRGDPNAELYADAKALSAEAVGLLAEGLLDGADADPSDEAEIRRVQQRLYTLYYLPKGGIDGKMGPNSRAALKEFQATNQLDESGEADVDTRAALFSRNAAAKRYQYRIKVSIDRQVVEIYERTIVNSYDLVQSFTCSTGLHDSTPRGIFLEGFPVNRWHYFEKFNCWAQYSYEITGDIMFHSVIYGSNSESSLRRNSVYALGNPASHGCIRLSVEDAKWLFEHCKKGKAVIVIS